MSPQEFQFTINEINAAKGMRLGVPAIAWAIYCTIKLPVIIAGIVFIVLGNFLIGMARLYVCSFQLIRRCYRRHIGRNRSGDVFCLLLYSRGELLASFL